MYDSEYSKNDINKSLSKYLVQPIQTGNTLSYINEHYPEDEILVAMSDTFSQKLAKQYETIGGNPDNVIFIGDAIKTFTLQNKSSKEIEQ